MRHTKALSIVREIREAKGMTREHLAKKIKVTPGYLSGIEGGSLAHSISPRVEEAIAKVLGNKAMPKAVVASHNVKSKAYHAARKSTKVIQGHLPGFLDQLSNVRIDEMVAEIIFKRLATRVESQVDQLFSVINGSKDKVG